MVFCSVATKLRSYKGFGFDLSEVIPVNVQTIHNWFPLHAFVKFMKKETSIKFFYHFS